MAKQTRTERFALCITDAELDLNRGKVYRVLPDKSARASRYLRIVDDSGEDYLYPSEYFVFVKLPSEAKRAVLKSKAGLAATASRS